MSQSQTHLKGVVHGKTIELERELDLPDGQEVTVSLQPSAGPVFVSGDGIRRSAGAFSDDPDGLDDFLKWNRQQRKTARPGILP